MSRISLILFIVGLLVYCAAFFLSNAESIPIVERIIAPRFVKARQGLDLLNQRGQLLPTDLGFGSLESLVRQRMKEDIDPVMVDRIAITRIGFGDATFSPEKQQRSIRISLSNGQVIDWDLKVVGERVESMRRTSFHRGAIVLLVIGLVLSISGYGLACAERAHAKRRGGS